MNRSVVCLKYGNKYSADYVNRLFNMVKRHNTQSVNFVCITEDPSGLHHDIQVLSLPDVELQGWWYKPYLFSSKFPITGTLLFLDLDIVIIQNMDHFWTHSPGKFCIIRDFNRSLFPDWKKFNSSVFRLESHSNPTVWSNLVNNLTITKRMHGDQDWMFDQIKTNFDFWPDEWCQSYKWEIRDRNELTGAGNNKSFIKVTEPKIKPNTSILVFHGAPKPEQVKDPIVVDNWR